MQGSAAREKHVERRLTDDSSRRLGEKGFSLLELIVALVILGLVAAIGTPNVVSWLARLRSRATADEVVSTLQAARLQAIARNARLQVCLYRNATPHDFPDLTQHGPLAARLPGGSRHVKPRLRGIPPHDDRNARRAHRKDDPQVVRLWSARHGDRRQFHP